MCVLTISIYKEFCACDYASLSTFTKWVDKTKFCPRPDVKVQVKIKPDAVPPPLTHCVECKEKWEGAKIAQQLRLIDWGMVEAAGADLTVIASYIIISPNHCG